MNPTDILFVAFADIIAIALLCAMYLSRHKRRDLVVSYLVINVGVFAVTVALANADATSAGMGMGLFGVLSIIRLRSTELNQREVAYYFCALAIGLLAGIGLEPVGLMLGLMVLILAVMGISDSRSVMKTLRQQTVTVDRAISNDEDLKAYLGKKLGYSIETVTILDLDLVNDKTLVDIRYSTKDAVIPNRSMQGLVPDTAAELTSRIPVHSSH
ncbi:DUF4956 domain-containing protein [Rothia terrae]|jgi:hypothetical protein|uniref:DUF4956 domain-containing protein n=1 Tax=Rothia terrae TaxID=396015 RepID=UPI003813019A